MKTRVTTVVKLDMSTLCQRVVCVILAMVMMGNLTVEAAGVAGLSSEQLHERVEAQAQKAAAPKTPQQFLADTRAAFEQLAHEDLSATSDGEDQKLTKSEYVAAYKREVNRFYADQERQLDQAAADALADFDAQAKAAYDEQAASLEEHRAELSAESVAYAQEMLAGFQASLTSDRANYEAQVKQQQAQMRAELENEKAEKLAQSVSAYAQYEKEVAAALKEAETGTVKFYQELIHQVLVNYQKTNDDKSKENFVVLMGFLTSFANKDQIFTKADRDAARQALWMNFTAKSHACASRIETTYRSDGTWGSAAIGGSPSAGRSFDVGMNKTQVLKIDNEAACNRAISSLIPFANLNGEGWKITNFLQVNMDNPLFGQILLVGAKALMLTKNGGVSALGEFIDKAIAKENSGRKKTFWQSLDIMTGEGLVRNWRFDGKYFAHNVSSSAQRNPGEPNVWEDVAEMLAQQHTPAATAILNKAIDQCAVRTYGTYPKAKQKLGCQGIYPFLLGVLAQAPQLAENLKVSALVNTQPGQEFTASGSTRTVSEAEVARRREYQQKNDILNHTTRGELLGSYFYGQWFEDLYPADRQRMDGIVAVSRVLNPKGSMAYYSKNSDTYNKIVKKFNAKVVFVALGSVVDYVITLLLVKDVGRLLFRVGTLAKGVSNAMQARKIIMGYKLLPNSFGRSAKIAHVLQAKGFNVAALTKYNNVVRARKVRSFSSKVVANFREANAIKFDFKPAVMQSSHVRPLHNPSAAPLWAAARVEDLGAPVRGVPAFESAAQVSGSPINGWGDLWHAAKTPFVQAGRGIGNYFKEGGWPGKTKDAGGTALKTENLTIRLIDKKGNVQPIEQMSVEGGVLYINGKMAKTFKAYLPLEQVEALGALTRQENIALGFDGMWIKLVDKSQKASFLERFRALDKNVVTVPLYDAAGQPLLHVGFNPGYKPQKALLDMLQGENPAAKLVFKDGKIHLYKADNTFIRTLSEFDEIAIPKRTFENVMKAKQLPFLERLFALDNSTTDALRMEQTGSKLFFPFAVNFLSYSAAASALTMTLEDAGWSPTLSTLAGLTLPYATAPLAPVLSPFVKRFGARRVLNSSLLLAGGSLGMVMATGWSGHGMVTGEDGKKQIVAPKWSLMSNALLTGLASTGVRASSGLIVKGYETSKSVMAASMLGKSAGAMLTSLIPAIAYWSGNEAVDFSGAYPWMLGGTLAVTAGLRLRIPNKPNPTFFKQARLVGDKPFRDPWQLLGKREVLPYVAGITLMSSLEGYVYFKGLSAWDRDKWSKLSFGHDEHGKPNANAVFLASLSTAIPQLVWRWSGKGIKAIEWGRKGAFNKGVYNSAAMALGGGLMFALTDEDNIPLGILSGVMIGTGTANIYQYTQQLMLHSVRASNAAKTAAGMAKTTLLDDKAAMTVYSAGNFGLALPAIPAIVAGSLKAKGEGEVEAAKHTTVIPLMAYITGLGFVTLGQITGLNHIASLLKDTRRVISPWVTTGVVGGVGGANALLYTQQQRLLNQPAAVPVMPAAQGFKLELPAGKFQMAPSWETKSCFGCGPVQPQGFRLRLAPAVPSGAAAGTENSSLLDLDEGELLDEPAR